MEYKERLDYVRREVQKMSEAADAEIEAKMKREHPNSSLVARMRAERKPLRLEKIGQHYVIVYD